MDVTGGEITLVQITDTHLFADPSQRMRGLDTAETLRRVVAHVHDHCAHAAACLLTGDLSDDGKAESYRLLREIMGVLDMPLLTIPGNHDDKALMAAMLDDGHWRYCPVHDIGDWCILNLDSAVDGAGHGHLDAAQLETVQAAAAMSGGHVLICVHHPPVAVGSRWLDRIRLTNGADLFAAMNSGSRVRGVLWGHVHQEYSERRDGVLLLGSPSTCVQFAPGREQFAVDPREPGYRVIRLGAQGALSSRVERVPG